MFFKARCSANLGKFAQSEFDYLTQLHAKVADTEGACSRRDKSPLRSISAFGYRSDMFDDPGGGFSDVTHSRELVQCSQIGWSLFYFLFWVCFRSQSRVDR